MRPVLEEMVATRRISAKDAARDPRRHSLRSALRGSEIRLLDKSQVPLRLIPGDTIILASDGFDTLSHRAVIRLLRPGNAIVASKMVERLLTAVRSKRAHNQDNATVAYYNFGDLDVARWSHHRGGWQNWPWLILFAGVLCAVGYGLYVSTP
jgi:protein phosphatase